MSQNASLSLFSLTILLLFSTTIAGNNITIAFQKHSNFSIMSNLFIKANLTIPISKFLTITILAVSNDAIRIIANRSDVELKNILMTHVILDYYDDIKLKGLEEKSIMLTTLYQTTGLGEEMNGFLNCTKSKDKVFFGSEVKNSPLDAEYVSTLYNNPYNLSIIQISMPIVAPGLSIAVNPPPPPPAPLAPAPSPTAMTPASSPFTTLGPGDQDYGSDTTTPATETPEDDSPAPAPSSDNEKIEAADKATPSSSACKAGLSIALILLLALFS